MLTNEQRREYDNQGYLNVRKLFSDEEVERYRRHFMDLRRAGSYPGDSAGVDGDSRDPLKRYPRMIHMHRWDEISLQWMLDARLRDCMADLLGREPFAVQTMLYFKPPGARGQALHQDQYYLRVQPGVCIAAWLALDDCDEENGCLQMVPDSHTWPLLCSADADTTQSFTDVTVDLPAGIAPEPIIMQAGDVVFFNGNVVHGSFPNTSASRFRRASIGHYIAAEAEQVARFYHPVLRMDGTEVELSRSPGGDMCGRWVDVDGAQVIEMQRQDGEARLNKLGRAESGRPVF